MNLYTVYIHHHSASCQGEMRYISKGRFWAGFAVISCRGDDLLRGGNCAAFTFVRTAICRGK